MVAQPLQFQRRISELVLHLPTPARIIQRTLKEAVAFIALQEDAGSEVLAAVELLEADPHSRRPEDAF